MAPFVRRLPFAMLLVFHAAISLGGPGMHALPGWSHDSGLKALSKNDHTHGPGKSSHQSAEDCPVCHFLNDRQVSTDQAAAVAFRPVDRQPQASEPQLPSSPVSVFENPRAPPSLILSA